MGIYWLDLETDYQHVTRGGESSEPSTERLPTLFSLDHVVPRLLTAFIFYWLVPLVLTAITWKAAARVEWGVPLVLLTGLITLILVFLRIRRCPVRKRAWNIPRWGVMVLLLGGMAVITSRLMPHLRDFSRPPFERAELVIVPRYLPRPSHIFRADLKGEWLVGVNLRYTNANQTNFQGANLIGALLQGTLLRDANLQGALLAAARLQGADLRGARLRGTHLQGVKNLTHEQLQAARTDAHTQLPDALQSPSPLWGGLRRSKPPPR